MLSTRFAAVSGMVPVQIVRRAFQGLVVWIAVQPLGLVRNRLTYALARMGPAAPTVRSSKTPARLIHVKMVDSVFPQRSDFNASVLRGTRDNSAKLK